MKIKYICMFYALLISILLYLQTITEIITCISNGNYTIEMLLKLAYVLIMSYLFAILPKKIKEVI